MVDDEKRTDGAVRRIERLKREEVGEIDSKRGGSPKRSAARPPTDRLHRRPKQRRKAIRDRLQHGLGQPKTRHTPGARASSATAATGWLPTAGTDVTRARETPPVAALPKRRPRRSAHTTHALRPVAGRRGGTTPRPGAVEPPGARPPCASRAFVPEARRDAMLLGRCRRHAIYFKASAAFRQLSTSAIVVRGTTPIFRRTKLRSMVSRL